MEFHLMLVETYLGYSAIHGIGLFTKEKILANTKIWQFDEKFDLILTIEQLKKLPEWKQTFFNTYCFMNNGLLYYCCDNARFMNHSENPNSYDLPDGTYALVDIEEGTELTCNYAGFGITSEDLEFNFSPLNSKISI